VLSYVGQLASVRTPPVGLDGVRSVVYCQFSKKIGARFCPIAAKGGTWRVLPGRGSDLPMVIEFVHLSYDTIRYCVFNVQ